MSLVQEIVDLELGRLHKAAQAGELTLDQARKLVLFLRVHEPAEDDSRPLGKLTNEELRAAVVNAAQEQEAKQGA